MRLQKLSELEWEGICTSHRHSFGMEPISQDAIIPKTTLPSFVTPEVELSVFRSNGDNRTFVGVQQEKIVCIFLLKHHLERIVLIRYYSF